MRTKSAMALTAKKILNYTKMTEILQFEDKQSKFCVFKPLTVYSKSNIQIES